MIMTKSVSSNKLKLIKATAAIPTNAPIHDQMISEGLTAGGLFVVPCIFFKNPVIFC
jgi:hypothetical protein